MFLVIDPTISQHNMHDELAAPQASRDISIFPLVERPSYTAGCIIPGMIGPALRTSTTRSLEAFPDEGALDRIDTSFCREVGNYCC